MDTYEPQTIRLSYSGEGEVTAKDIETNQHVEIVNEHQFIATLSESAKGESTFPPPKKTAFCSNF